MRHVEEAILQSGVGSTVTSLDTAVMVAEQFLKIFDLGASDIEALRALTVEQLLPAELELRAKMAGEGVPRLTVTVPVIDGKTIPELPIEAIKRGSASSIPMLVGTCLEEWKLLGAVDLDLPKLDEAGLVRRCQNFIPAEHVPGLIEAHRSARAKRGATTSPADIYTAIQTDFMFRVPAARLVEAQYHHNQSAYNYLFTWKSPILDGILGACHALDLGFLFGTYDDSFCGSGPAADTLARNIQDAWLAFAHTGDPSCESIGTWPPYGERRETMMLGEECHTEEAPYEEERRAWDFLPDVFTEKIRTS